MTRFDADDAEGRQKLVADAVAAHRERASAFLTLEVDGAALGDDAAEDDPAPWVQYAGEEGVLNLDCTDEELDRLDGLLAEFPAFKVRERTEPKEAEATNLKVGALADGGRIGQFVDRLFVDVYGLDDDYRLWVARL
jgi:hypothetical protein